MKAVREFLRTCRRKGFQGDYLRCSVISKERLLQRRWEKEYFCLCVQGQSREELPEELYLTQRKGTYAVIRHYGGYGELAASYQELMDFIARQGLTILGNAYETELMGYISQQKDSDYVIEIAIEVGRA